MAKETIRIKGIAKFCPVKSSGNIFEVKNSLKAEEVLNLVGQMKAARAQSLSDVRLQHFSDQYSYGIIRSFVVKDIKEITTEQKCAFLSSVEGKNSFELYLANMNLESLVDVYGDFLENSGEKRVKWYDKKENLIRVLVSDPMKLLMPHESYIIRHILEDYLLSFAKAMEDNLALYQDTQEPLLFNIQTSEGLRKGMPRFFKLANNKRGYNAGMRTFTSNFEEFKELFKAKETTFDDKNCFLDTEDTESLQVLKEFIKKSDTVSYLLEPIYFRIEAKDINPSSTRTEEERKKYLVSWPNNMVGLEELFGQRAKSKFLTLRNGLELLSKLEPSRKFIEIMQGKKILLNLFGFYRSAVEIGTILETKAIEVLMLYLKLESVQHNSLVICTVQEKITEETLAYLWQRVESGNKWDNHDFCGYQLTE